MIPIIIPLDIVEGSDCLRMEVPWIVPEAIYKMDDELNGDDVVLEFGTGGSTLFFARRCNKVIGIETGREWADKVIDEYAAKSIANIKVYVIPDEDAIIERVYNLYTDGITVLSVDTQGGYNRSRILNAFLSKGVSPNLRMIILDNYSHSQLFPEHFDNNNIVDGWDVFSFDHERWAGSGTKILIKTKQ